MDAVHPPSTVIGAVFTKLMLVYGTRFTSTYAGQDPGMVRQHWAHELRGLDAEQCAYALEHLPAEHPPNVLQFRSIALAGPRPAERALALPAPEASPERVRELLARAAVPRERASPVQVWQRVLENPSSTMTAREMAREALQRLMPEASE